MCPFRRTIRCVSVLSVMACTRAPAQIYSKPAWCDPYVCAAASSYSCRVGSDGNCYSGCQQGEGFVILAEQAVLEVIGRQWAGQYITIEVVVQRTDRGALLATATHPAGPTARETRE